MSNFVKENSAAPRFPGDFYIKPIPGYSPSSAEQPYIDAVNAFVDRLAAEDASDIAAGYPEKLLKGRQAARATAMFALEADAARFITGQNAAGDRTRLDEIERHYISVVAKFGTRDSPQPRFEGDFDTVIVAGYAPGGDEQALLDSVEAAKAELAVDKGGDDTGSFSKAAIALRQGLRKAISDDLRSQIEGFFSSGKSAKAAAEQVLLTRGQYQARRERVKRRLFNVTFTPGKKRPEDDDLSVLNIRLLSGLPEPDDRPSPEKEKLYVQINKAFTVVNKVCEGMEDRAERGLRAYFFGSKSASC